MQQYDPTQSIGFLIYEVARLQRRDFNQRVQSLGLTQAQWRALAHIAYNEGCNQSTLAEILEVTPITLTRLLDRLQQAQWIERRNDPDDRRAMQLFICEKAWPLLYKMKELAMETRDRSFVGISAQHQQLLTEILRTMKKNLGE